MTQESIDAFLVKQKQNDALDTALRRYKCFVTTLFQWLPEDKELSRERLALWREDMVRKGYAQQTVSNYVKGINLYLDHMGWSGIRFSQGRAKDIRNMTFGYLTPVEPTDHRNRRDVVWRCRCKCGKITQVPAARLLSGNTLSCGCMKAENMRTGCKNIAGTNLNRSLKEVVANPDSVSGYTGVAPKGDKWRAYITYRGKRYHLGTFLSLEDAVKARASAKEQVMEDAQQLLTLYETIHADDPKGLSAGGRGRQERQ